MTRHPGDICQACKLDTRQLSSQLLLFMSHTQVKPL